jgi:hypothetical protein
MGGEIARSRTDAAVLTGYVAVRKGWPGDPLCAASKGAIRSFVRALAVEESILRGASG